MTGMTRAELLDAALGMMFATIPRSDTVRVEAAHIIDLASFVTTDAPDASDGFLAFIAAINNSPSKQVIGRILPGHYRLDSRRLSQAPPLIVRNGVTIRGEGKPTITLVGSVALPALLRFRNCDAQVEGIVFVGNSQGSGYTNGSSLQFLVDNEARSSINFVAVKDCKFENFKSPAWIYLNVSNEKYGIDKVMIDGNSARSRLGNTLDPANLGMRSAVFLIQSKIDEGRGGAGVKNIVISNNSIDARYIKTGIFLSDYIAGAVVEANHISKAGEIGAHDNAGGYAIAAYDSDGLGMRNIVFRNNTIDEVRSAGIYCAGVRDIVVDGIVGQGQTDREDASLPKGLVVLNGVARFQVGNVSASDIRDTAVYVVPNGRGTSGKIERVTATRCRNAIYIASAFGPNSIAVNDLRARDCQYGILGNIVDGGIAQTWTFTRMNIVSSIAESFGVRIYSEGKKPIYPSLQIGTESKLDTTRAGISISDVKSQSIIVKNITFGRKFKVAGLEADDATGLNLSDLSFEGQDAGGVSLKLVRAQGVIGKSIVFHDVPLERRGVGVRAFLPGSINPS